MVKDGESKLTWTTIIRLHIANIPCLPSTLKNNWPIGKARSVLSKSGTDVKAKDAAIRVSHPSEAVAPTPMRIAMGAAFAAPEVSSEMCAAESSENCLVGHPSWLGVKESSLHPVRVHMGAVKARRKAQPSTHTQSGSIVFDSSTHCLSIRCYFRRG